MCVVLADMRRGELAPRARGTENTTIIADYSLRAVPCSAQPKDFFCARWSEAEGTMFVTWCRSIRVPPAEVIRHTSSHYQPWKGKTGQEFP